MWKQTRQTQYGDKQDGRENKARQNKRTAKAKDRIPLFQKSMRRNIS